MRTIVIFVRIATFTGLLLTGIAHGEEKLTSTEKGEQVSAAVNDINKLFTEGELRFLMNYRFEHVDDPTRRRDAYASTLRTVLGFETGRLYRFGANVEVEDIRVVGKERYNDGAANGKTQYAVVVDPEDTELNQAYLNFGKLDGVPTLQDTEFRAGRQLIFYRKAPFHRFVGPVVWRQNWQTFDGYTLTNRSLADTRISLGYIYNVNRIFGEDNPGRALHDKDLDGYLINVQYSGLPLGQLEAYAYLTAAPAPCCGV